MKPKQVLLFALLFCLSALNAEEQPKDRVIQLKHVPQTWDNRSFAFCYSNEKDVLNIQSLTFCTVGKVYDLKMSPACNTFAVLYARGNSRAVSLYSYIDGSVKHTFRLSDIPTAMAYSSNAKNLCIADKGRNIHIYELSKFKLVQSIPLAFAPQKIALSFNGYFVAASEDQMVYIYNMETGRMRKVIEEEATVNHIAFSPDNNRMAILLENGKLRMYDINKFALLDTYTGMMDARECMFHPEGKYIAVITATDKITILNMKNPTTDRQKIDAGGVGIRHLGYTRSAKGEIMLVYNAGPTFVFHPMVDLVPDYQHLVAEEVDDLMDDWLRQMPGETLEEYHLRVNEESRAAQYARFENQVATEMAGDRIQQAEVSLGNYNQEQSMLEINFDNMPAIYLEVPQEDVAAFSNPDQLIFDKSIYTVTEDDRFELLYTEVTNTETGKTYVFDNLDKQSLDYLSSDNNFVPLDLIQQSSMEEVKLQEIREEVVAAAKEADLISEHTHIDVKTKVDASTNADGDKIMNYTVEFNYDVEQEFSAMEDFGPGKYLITGSESAQAMLRIVQTAFQNEFKQYVRPGKKVVITVTGSADAAPINRKIPYAEEYGAHNETLVYTKGELTTITVNSSTGITQNEQLAFLRALGVQAFVKENLTELNQMHSDYEYHVNVSQERGSEFRRIGIKFVFIDAF
jgi:WD40 repeat protein